MDYIDELKRLRQGDGLVFRKTEREVKMAIEERVGEVRASMQLRADKIAALSNQHPIGNIDAVIQRVRELRDPFDVDVLSYEPAFAVVLAHALALRVEDDFIESLRFIGQNVTGDMELSFNALDMLFGPYSPHSLEREVSLRSAERNLRRSMSNQDPVVRSFKRRRSGEDEPGDINHFLASEY